MVLVFSSQKLQHALNRKIIMNICKEVLSNPLLLGKYLFGTIIFVFLLIPRYSIASSIYIVDHLTQDVDSLSNLAQEHHTWAVKHHSEPGMIDSVISRAKLSLGIREQLWKENPNIDLGKSYHNLGTFLKMKGDYSEAKKYLKEAVNVYTKLDHDRVLRSLLELGKIYKQEGDFVSAEEYFKLVIQISKERGNDQKTRAAVVDLGSTYVDAFRDTSAIAHLEKYASYFDVSNKNDKAIIGKFYNNLASAYLRNNNYDKAINTYKKASLFDTSNYITQAKIFTNLAIAFRMKKQFKNCFNALTRGKEFAYKSQNLEQMSFSHVGLAKYHEFQSEHALAISEYQKSIELLLPSFSYKDEFSNPKPEDLTFAINKISLLSNIEDKVKATINLDKKKYKAEILELFKLGDVLIDDMRKDHFNDDAKLYWRSVAFPFYEEALSYCFDENAYKEAFYFFEKSKSVLLLEGYSFNEAISKTSEIHKERYLSLRAHLHEMQNKNQTKLVDEVVNSQRDFETFVDSLFLLYPKLFRKYSDHFLMSLPEFQRNIVEDTATIYIHYFFGKKKVYAYAIEKDKFAYHDLGPSQKIDSLIVDLKHFFLHPAQIDNDFKAYQKVSNALYESLLAPLIHYGHKEVVIMPDGPIASIPFEALISQYSNDKEMKYAIQDRIFRYSFSGSILNNLNDSEYRDAIDVVTFVPFDDDDNMKSVDFSGVQKKDFENAKANGLNVKYFKGSEASKERLLSFEGRLPILHFSSHGFTDEKDGPKILLANSEMSLSELYTSSLPSDMVFLSACKTSLGENSYGEGIQSMARGFTFAGANSVVSSLWNVIAAPNSKIVKSFYENISSGQTKHLALHNAKLAYLEDSNVPSFEKSPYYWAGLVYYGESDNIIKPKRAGDNYNLLLYISLAFILVASYFGVKYYRSKQANLI